MVNFLRALKGPLLFSLVFCSVNIFAACSNKNMLMWATNNSLSKIESCYMSASKKNKRKMLHWYLYVQLKSGKISEVKKNISKVPYIDKRTMLDIMVLREEKKYSKSCPKYYTLRKYRHFRQDEYIWAINDCLKVKKMKDAKFFVSKGLEQFPKSTSIKKLSRKLPGLKMSTSFYFERFDSVNKAESREEEVYAQVKIKSDSWNLKLGYDNYKDVPKVGESKVDQLAIVKFTPYFGNFFFTAAYKYNLEVNNLYYDRQELTLGVDEEEATLSLRLKRSRYENDVYYQIAAFYSYSDDLRSFGIDIYVPYQTPKRVTAGISYKNKSFKPCYWGLYAEATLENVETGFTGHLNEDLPWLVTAKIYPKIFSFRPSLEYSYSRDQSNFTHELLVGVSI